MSIVSIVIIAKNESNFIKKCLNSVLSQTFKDFELIIIDDKSTDNTKEIILSFDDKRINLIDINEEKTGYGNLRNYALQETSGKYIFFTDADCVPHYNWIKEALVQFKKKGCVGVEGKTFYESEGAITVSDYFTYRVKPEGYMTCNVAYLRDYLKKLGGFDSNFKYVYEDRDLGIRMKKLGKVNFSPNMLIFHQQKKLTIKNLFIRARRAGDMIYFDKKHGRKNSEYIKKNIMYPAHLIIVFFPPLIFLSSRIETSYDLYFTFMKYFSFVYERFIIWKSAIKYKKIIL